MPTPPIEKIINRMTEVTRSLNTSQLGHSLWEMLGDFIHIDNMAVVCFSLEQRPQLIFKKNNNGIYNEDSELTQYIEGAYLLDPFYLSTCQGIKTGCYRLENIAPDDFHKSTYFQQYYRFSDLIDELGFLFQFNSTVYIHLSIASSKKITPNALKVLVSLTEWLEVIMSKQWGPIVDSDINNTVKDKFKIAFNHFGSSILTKRECQIAKLILQGHSTKSIASRLKLSPETIKVHRRNLYPKLDITSQPELFSLFLNAISLVQDIDSKDPLIAYQKKST